MQWWLVLLGVLPAALLLVPKELWLPLKVQIAVSLLGWKGFLNVVKENIATRTLGLKTTASRQAWHTLADTMAAFDTRYLSPERGVVTDDDIAEGHMLGLHLLATAVELFAYTDHVHPGERSRSSRGACAQCCCRLISHDPLLSGERVSLP